MTTELVSIKRSLIGFGVLDDSRLVRVLSVDHVLSEEGGC
jgi:hypothetical protein